MESAFDDAQVGLLATTGAALVLSQLLERPLDLFCELAASHVVIAELLEGLAAGDRRRTVGQMMQRLKSAVEVDPEVDQRLQQYLDDCNALVRRLESDGRSLSTRQGRRELSLFLASFLNEADWLLYVLPGLLLAWSRHVGMLDAFHRTLGCLGREYLTAIDGYAFMPKE